MTSPQHDGHARDSHRPAARKRPGTAHTITILTALGLLLAPLAAPPLAAQPGIDDLVEMSIQELLETEVATVYGASKFEQQVTDAPSSVTIVTAEQISSFGYRTLAEILASVRGFYATYDRNYHYLGVRGFNRPGDYNTRILTLINGHRINDSIYEGSALGTDFPLDVDLIERVEVVRGPSSSLYGTSAFFAVVNVVTRDGRGLDGWEVMAEGASHDTGRGRLTYGRRFDNGLDVLFSGSLYDSAGPDLFYPEYDDPETNGGVADGVDDDRFESFFFSTSYRGFKVQASYVSREKGIPTGSYEVVFNDPRNETIDSERFFEVQYRHDLAAGLEVAARLSYDRYDYDGGYVYDWADPGDEPDLVVNQDLAVAEWWGTELTFVQRIQDDHRLTFGFEYRDDMRQDQQNFDREVYLDDRRSSEVPAVYAQGEFQLHEDLLLSLGLRHDRYDTFGGTTNPRAALIYRPVERTAVKLLYGEAFRAPNAFELFYNDGGLSLKANPDLEPETIRTLEMVWEHYFNANLRTAVSAYRYEVDNLISQQTDPADELLVFNNVEEVEARGIELEAEGSFKAGLELYAGLVLQEAEDAATGEVLTSSPRELAQLRLASPLLGRRLKLAAETHFIGRRRTLAGATLGSFAVTHLTLRAPEVAPGLELSAHVHNLFDKSFSDPGSGEHLQDALEQDGRTLRLRVAYRF